MSRITGVVVALATTAAVLTGSTAGAGTGAAAPPTAQLPREIIGGVELTLADGDVLRVWTAESHRTVWAKRYDTATGAWGARTVVLARKNLFCGDVDARTANGAVAVIAECDRYGWSEDQAPTSSRALWSPDTVSWTSYELEGEAYEEPGISPDGSRAVWPEFRGYVTFGPEGFTRHTLSTPGQEYTATATITDTGQVSYLYGRGFGGRCGLVVLTRAGAAPPTRQEIAFDGACTDSNFANVDSDTTLFGEFDYPATVTTIARASADSPWAVTQVAPVDAPGLVTVERGTYTRFFTAPGSPLVALGSRTGRRVRAQVYDPGTQSWSAPITVLESGAQCNWGPGETAQPLAVIVAVVRCRGNHIALTTRDGLAWQALRMGPRSLGQTRDGQYVAVPGPASTHVISPELGVVTLPGGVAGRCDVVVPDGPDAAVQVVATSGSRQWPVVLRHVSSGGTERLGRARTPTPGRCREVEQSYDRPTRFDMGSTRMDRGQTMQVVRRGDDWQVRIKEW
ncbi:hypothetical protein [Nocardioides sp.]|uniref:hypothetical protein n=1 Tax=Nocardioides sp. TaxID=35761 RepID=UPI0035AEE694